MEDYDFVIIGSGAGGATVAYELSKSEKKVLVIEKGSYEKEIGGAENTKRYVDRVRSIEGINIMRAIVAGGTTIISAGNIVPCLEDELNALGIEISDELEEAKMELNAGPISEKLLSDRSKLLQKAASQLGYSLDLMPKCIDANKCDKCTLCMTGCKRGAKWTSLDYLEMALENGANAMYDTEAIEILHDHMKVRGVMCRKNGDTFEITSKCVILAAGGLSTPVILLSSDIKEAGGKLSVDLLKHVYGFVKGHSFKDELPMPMVAGGFISQFGFILSPNVNHGLVKKYIRSQGTNFPYTSKNVLGMMIKIKDEPNGKVFPDGTVSKPVSEKDLEKFRIATNIIKEIYLQLGVDEAHIFDSPINGAHPCGTAAIGDVVDTNLETRIKGLYVCDASVLPEAPGLPPILTIVALAKRLGKRLIKG